MFTKIKNIEYAINPLAPLANVNIANFVRASLLWTYTDYGIDKNITERLLDKLIEYRSSPSLAATKILADMPVIHEKEGFIQEKYTEYQTRIKPRFVFDLISPHLIGKTIANIGCGNNALAHEIIKNIKTVEQVIGSDILNYKSTNKSEKIIYLQQQSSCSVPINDNTVDTILLISMLHHVRNEEIKLFLKEIYRIARQNARVILIEDTFSQEQVATHADNSVANFFNKLNAQEKLDALPIIDWIGGELIPGFIGMVHPFNFKTMEDWATLFHQQGFSRDHSHFIGFSKGRFHLNPQAVMTFTII